MNLFATLALRSLSPSSPPPSGLLQRRRISALWDAVLMTNTGSCGCVITFLLKRMISDLDSSFVLVDGHVTNDPKPSASNTSKGIQKGTAKLTEKVAKLQASEEPPHLSTIPSYNPGSSRSYAHQWDGKQIHLQGRHFVDNYGRICQLRGVNLSGSCKTPVNHSHNAFPGEHRAVTFVGRPFPLEEAHGHFSRLRRWGFTFLRFLVTWEAIEHHGPGQYDREYLSYIRSLLSLLPQYGMVAFVSLHQDVWSRYSGGSGAPAWTLESVGFDLDALEETGAAWLGGMRGGEHVKGSERGIWPTGYSKLAASTMATVFWAGDTFAPKLKVKNPSGQEVSMQSFLQDAFLDMFDELVKAVEDLEAVIGFEMMNEPHRGYIDLKSLHSFDYNVDLHLSHMPSAFQSFQLGAGHPTRVPTYKRFFIVPTMATAKTILNPKGRKAWTVSGPTRGQCLWEMHDVWGWDTKKNEAIVLRENYFARHPETGKRIDWYTDLYYPFLKRWESRVRRIAGPSKLLFVEPIPNELCPSSWTAEHRLNNMVYAPHWYDLYGLFWKAFGNFTVNVQGLQSGMFPLKTFYWGQKGAMDNYSLQIQNIVQKGYTSLGETPVFIGECGVPMDMNDGEAFSTERFTWQARMMDAMLTGLERTLVGFTLWNYNPYNDDEKGDDWNGENFSWFSQRRALPPTWLDYEQNSPTLDNGGRILDSVVRPYPAKTAGIPLKFEYEMTVGKFVFEWKIPEESKKADDLRCRETEIFLPSRLAHGRKILVSGFSPEEGSWTYDESRQTLFVVTKDTQPGRRFRIEVTISPPHKPPFEVNDFWSDFSGHLYASGILVTSVVVCCLSLYWIKI